MHIPSKRIMNEMRAETASLWFVPANDEKETALLIKCPTPTIKALTLGCPIQLLFGKKDNILCTGVRIQDVSNHPLLISSVQKNIEEHQALTKSIKQRNFPLFLFNEMDICEAWTNLEISKDDADALLDFISDESSLYVGAFNNEASFALDCFQYTFDNEIGYPDAHLIPTIEISPKVEKWTSNKIYFYGNEGFKKIEVTDIDEGGNFENTIYSALGSVFPSTLFKSPQLKIVNKVRELTDIFAFYQYGSFLFETKDLSVINAGFERSQTRRLSGIQQQIEKAIKQLTGAVKAFKRGETIIDCQGEEIIVDRKIKAHCIILITELPSYGEWENIVSQLIEAMKNTQQYFHILDLQELMNILKLCKGNAELIDYNLIKRCEFSIEKMSIHIRSC